MGTPGGRVRRHFSLCAPGRPYYRSAKVAQRNQSKGGIDTQCLPKRKNPRLVGATSFIFEVTKLEVYLATRFCVVVNGGFIQWYKVGFS